MALLSAVASAPDPTAANDAAALSYDAIQEMLPHNDELEKSIQASQTINTL